MCTLVAIHQASAAFPLIVAANRDEMYTRASEGPAVRHGSDGDTPFIAGVDVSLLDTPAAGPGTWLGAAKGGFFVGLTNQRSFSTPDPTKASRGEVVRDLLRGGSLASALTALEALDPSRFNGFNLLLGDATELHVAYARPERSHVEHRPLAPGVHVLANDRMGSTEFPKAPRIEAQVRGLLGMQWPELRTSLVDVLGGHDEPPLDAVPEPPKESRFDRPLLRRLQATCIHTPIYGTVSSSVIAVGYDDVAEYWFTDGAPCTNPLMRAWPREGGW